MHNQRGFTLIELMIAMMIGVVLMGAVIISFSKQEKLLRDSNSDTYLRAQGRLAMDELATQIRQAGYGLPPGDSESARNSQSITVATASVLTYLINTTGNSTMLAVDATAGDTTITVQNIGIFSDGNPLTIFNILTPSEWEAPSAGILINATPTLGGTAPATWGTLSLDTALANSYTATDGVLVQSYSAITYRYDAAVQGVCLDLDGTADCNVAAGDIPIATNVSNFQFDYSDSAGATTALVGDIRKVGISMTLQDPENTTNTVTFNSDVNVRNLGK